MAQDNRNSSRTLNGFEIVQGGTAVPVTALELRDEETFSVSNVKVENENAATTEAFIEVYDETSDTAEEDLSDVRDGFFLSPGDTLTLEDLDYSDFEDDIVLYPSGAQDARVLVTIGGVVVTG